MTIDNDNLKQLLDELRQSSSPEIWSRGVTLAREDRILQLNEIDQSASFNVIDPKLKATPKVELDFDALDWYCNCPLDDDPCYHTTAAAIAFNSAIKNNTPLKTGEHSSGSIEYFFFEKDDMLGIGRRIRIKDKVIPFLGSLAKPQEVTLTPSNFDITIDVKLTLADELPKADTWRELAPHLEHVEKIFFNAEQIKFYAAPARLKIDLSQNGDTYFLSPNNNDDFIKVYKNGIAHTKNGFHCFQFPTLKGSEKDYINSAKGFGRKDYSFLFGELLPKLEQRFEINDKTQNAPKVKKVKADVFIDIKSTHSGITAKAQIVYGDPIIATLEGDTLRVIGQEIPLRNPDEEKALSDLLWKRLGLFLNQPKEFSTADSQTFLEKLTRDWKTPSIKFKEVGYENFGVLRPSASFANDIFELNFDNNTEESTKTSKVSGEQVLEAWKRGESHIKIGDFSFAEIPSQWLKLNQQLIEDLLDAKKFAEKTPKALHSQVCEMFELTEQTPPLELATTKAKLEEFRELEQALIPEQFKGELRDYQKYGVNWLSYMKSLGIGVLLADDMGLGKTIQTIAVIESPTLIVAPASLIHNWANEINKFNPSLKINIYHGPSRSLIGHNDVTITTYNVMRLDIDEINQMHWKLIVLDEAQAIKNRKSQVAQAAYQLNSAAKIALTGTPIENHLDDLWSQYYFLNPGLLGTPNQFRERYVKHINNGDSEITARLQRRLKPLLLRRLKSEVAKELPEKTIFPTLLDLSSEEMGAYASLSQQIKGEIKAEIDQSKSVFDLLEILLRLRQVACDYRLLPAYTGTPLPTTKTDFLCESVASNLENGHHVLVFSQWTSYLDIIESNLDNMGAELLRIDGSTKNRQNIVDTFQSSSSPICLLMTLKAGGVGLNLTRADHVYITDPWWNPAAENQAIDRAHRIGQENPVFVHKLITRGTVEEKIFALQSKKQLLSESVIGSGGASYELTRDDLLGLID